MNSSNLHIEKAVVSRPPRITYGYMYSMHKYWSKKSPDVIAAYIERYTKPGDIVLDPFCGSGIVACEAVRLSRRAIVIDINPMATFITKMTLTPVNLSRLQQGFREVKSMCEEAISKLFVTTCCHCGKNAVVEFVVKNEDISTEIAYSCTCSDKRLFKKPDERDKKLERSFEKRKIPFWYPYNVPLPVIRKERFQFVHELFTKRNLIALSTIFNAIEKLKDPKTGEIMKLAFTAALDKCSRLKPLSRAKGGSRPSLQEGWIAVRFYTPKMWQEVNPWYAFTRSFERVYKGKKESNARLKYAIMGSTYDELCKGNANVLIFTGSSDTILKEQLPEHSVDYVLTDPPFSGDIQYLALSTFWGAWLKFDFDYDKEVTVNHHRGKTVEEYNRRLGEIIASISRTVKPNKYVHIFCHDVRGPYLHNMLKLMSEYKIVSERMLHQPPTSSFGARVRNIIKTGEGHYGDYIVRGKRLNGSIPASYSVTESTLYQKVAKAAHMALQIRGGNASLSSLLHSVYQKLSGEEIVTFAQYTAEDFLRDSIKEFATIKKNQAQVKDRNELAYKSKIEKKIRAIILDAKALHRDQKHQIYQSVLGRLQEKGITLDLIYEVEKRIKDLEVKEYRIKRYFKLLQLFGKELGFRSTRNKTRNEVLWQKDTRIACSFLITDKHISVNASRPLNGENIASEIGTISFSDLEESVLWKWCQENPNRAYELRNSLNPTHKTGKPATSPRHLLLKVLENRKLCPKHYLITLQTPKGVNLEPYPGQFFHVVCDLDQRKSLTEDTKDRGYTLTLRRPFSVHRVNYADFDRRLLAVPSILPYRIRSVIQRPVSKIDILYKVVGEGTKSLSHIRRGTTLDVIGPIGNGFSIGRGGTGVIVAGGIGVAPLVLLAEKLRYFGVNISLYLGALTRDLLRPILSRHRPDSIVDFSYANGTAEFCQLITKEFTDIGAKIVRVCTDDGSVGEKGAVTDILERDLKSGVISHKNVTIYACGPSKMMRAVSNIAQKYKIPCQVLLEERMACGIGACLSCTCNTKNNNGRTEKKRVCVDGPVFNAEEIIWQD